MYKQRFSFFTNFFFATQFSQRETLAHASTAKTGLTANIKFQACSLADNASFCYSVCMWARFNKIYKNVLRAKKGSRKQLQKTALIFTRRLFEEKKN
jgi:hypothetical protein